ncbi:TPA: hypothetical protein ACGCGR_000872 [Stenotrophomonas maltophilia]
MQIVMEVNDENGNRVWDLASRLGLLCGVAWSDTTPGNGFAANLPPGEFFYIPIIPSDSLGYVPVVGYANGRVYWALNKNGSGQFVGTIKPVKFYYGVR